MQFLLQDFPDIAGELMAVSKRAPDLDAAISDHEEACRHALDPAAAPGERALWSEVRVELVTEIRLLFGRLDSRQVNVK